MGVYKRKLKDGTKWRYKGYYKGRYYTSPAKYGTPDIAREAERVYLASLRGDTLQGILEDRIAYLQAYSSNHDYLVETSQKIGQFIEYFGPNFPVTGVTRGMAQEFINHIARESLEKNFSPHRPNHFIRILRAFFTYGIDMKDLDMRNPFKKMKLLPVSDEKKYIPTTEEIYRVRQCLSLPQKALFRFVDETGCRINEAIRLEVSDVNGNRVTLRSRKAKNSNLTPRVIPRPDCLRKLPARGRVFHHWTNNPRFLEETIKQLKLSPKWNWHNLRHRRASIWANEGMPIFEIMVRLGHVNMSTTMIYLQSLGFTSA